MRPRLANFIKKSHGLDGPILINHCVNCFTGSTKIQTYDGIMALGDLVGTRPLVLTNTGYDRNSGYWVEAKVESFGEQKIWEIELTRNQQTKVIRTTENHEWFVKSGVTKASGTGKALRLSWGEVDQIRSKYATGEYTQKTLANEYSVSQPTIGAIVRNRIWKECDRYTFLGVDRPGPRSVHRVVKTADLQKQYRLAHLLPQSKLLVDEIVPSSLGIMQGICFGDGTTAVPAAVHMACNLWGDKDAQLLQYFPESCRTEPIKTPNGVAGIRVKDIPKQYKYAPSMDESLNVLYGWLAGYMAADGAVSEPGHVAISSAQKEHLEIVQRVANRLGIAYHGIKGKMRQGCYGRGVLHDVEMARHGMCALEQPSMLYSITFVNSSLRPDFFLTKDHRDRFEAKSFTYERLGWMVQSVRETEDVEEVFCPVVPGTNSFALEDNIWTHNCGSGALYARSDGTTCCDFCRVVFSAQIQPLYSGLPQTPEATGDPVDAEQAADPSVPTTGPSALTTAPTPEEMQAPPGMAPPPGGDPQVGTGPSEDPNAAAGMKPPPTASHRQAGNAPESTATDTVVPPAEMNKQPDSLDQGDVGTEKLSFITDEGIALPYHSYVKHLAIKHAQTEIELANILVRFQPRSK